MLGLRNSDLYPLRLPLPLLCNVTEVSAQSDRPDRDRPTDALITDRTGAAAAAREYSDRHLSRSLAFQPPSLHTACQTISCQSRVQIAFQALCLLWVHEQKKRQIQNPLLKGRGLQHPTPVQFLGERAALTDGEQKTSPPFQHRDRNYLLVVGRPFSPPPRSSLVPILQILIVPLTPNNHSFPVSALVLFAPLQGNIQKTCSHLWKKNCIVNFLQAWSSTCPAQHVRIE